MKYLFIVALIMTSVTFVLGQNKEYICPPCHNSCDQEVFHKPGVCPHCNMKLISKASADFDNLSPEEFCNRITANPKAVILDVRSGAEFKGNSFSASYGHFNNAININITDLQNRLKELEPYKDQEILIYCSHSIRSPQACALLKENGFNKVANMAGGVSTINLNLTGCLKNNFVKH